MGNGPAQFKDPAGLALLGERHLVVCDYENGRVQVLTTQGVFITTFDLDAINRRACRPLSVAVDRDRRILVTGAGNDVRVFGFPA